MKILVIGSDGRTHALIWKLFNSPMVSELVCAPGNGGTSMLAPSVDLDLDDTAAVARWAFEEGIDIIIPADSRPLWRGLVDEVVAFQIGVCGPSERSTVLEHSRCHAKEFMLRHNLPSAPGRVCADLDTAEKYLATQSLPVIIKADSPEGGEAIYHERHAALVGVRELFAATPRDGDSGGVVIERYLQGPRVALSAFTDGRTAVPLLATRLYDYVENGDTGARAQGIGAHTGISRFAELLTAHLHQKFILPIVAGLAAENLPYWGILGIDCIITDAGPRLTGLRCGLAEGEAQVVLPRMEDDLVLWVQAMIAQRLHDLPPPRWKQEPSVGLGLIARGYPRHFPTGGLTQGLEDLEQGVLAFHSATENPAGLRYTPRAVSQGGLFGLLGGLATLPSARVTGGHVLTIVALGATLDAARATAHRNAGRITFDGRTFREDIGAREFG
jgi:phosphoribosylamine--glycine ligase